jgi:hypothetical protein
LAGSIAGAAFDLPVAALTSGRGQSAPKGKSPVIDVHAHLWTDDYLDLVESFGKKDTNT